MADPPLAPWLDKKPDKPAAPSAPAPDVPQAPWLAKKPDAPAPAKSADVPDVPVAPWLTKPDGVAGAKGAPAVPDAGGVAAPATPSASLSDRIAAAEKTNDIPAGLLAQVLTTESGLKPGAVNIKGSGATGLAQIMPATAKDPGYGIKPVNPNDPADSIRFAGQYLAALKKKTGSWAGAVRAYGSFASVVGPADQPLTNPQQVRLLAMAQAADQPSASTTPPPFQQPRDIARRVPPSTLGASADEIWKNFLTGMKQVLPAGAEAYRTQEAAQEKAGISPYGPLSPIAPAFQAATAAGGQAIGTVFNSAIETALAFAKDAGMDEAGLTRLRGDITQLLEVSQAAIPESGGELGRLHGEIKTTLEERAPAGTADAFDKASIPPTDRGPGITVHHGSPHQFQRFDMAKIGTGEGQQAFGYGLYFAENPKVAEGYKQPSMAIPENIEDFVLPQHREEAVAIKKRLDEIGSSAPDERAALLQKLSDMRAPGHVYTSTIHGTPDEFLHLDKPISEQSQHVKDALAKSPEAQAAIKRLGGDPTGEQVYRAMAEDLGGGPKTPMEKLPEADARVSKALNDAGIKGNRYRDHGSRVIGMADRERLDNYLAQAQEKLAKYEAEGADPELIKLAKEDVARAQSYVDRFKKVTHNYVVFNHGDVSITHVNGEHLGDIVAKARGAAPPGAPPSEPPFAGPPPGEPPAEPPPPTRAAITATQTALADRLHAHNQGVTADRIETMELGKAAQKAIPDAATREKLIHYQEQPNKIQITPEEKGLFDKHILPIIRAREWVQNKIADLEGRPRYPAWPLPRAEGDPLSHVPRFIKGVGSTIDWLLQGIGRRVGRQSLSKVGDKARTVPGPMIENPRIAYYKDAVVNNLVKLEESKRQLRNMEMLEHLKSTPELDHLREPTKPSGFGQTPGWKTAGPPQLAGIHWHPRIANAIDDAFKTFKRSGDAATFYAHVNRILVGSMFYSPIGHVLNVFADTLVSKGAIGTLADLATGRSFKAFGKALNDVRNLTPEYCRNLRASSSLQYGQAATENFIPDLVKGVEKHIKVDPKSWAEIARAGGYANPANLVAGLYRASRRGLWLAGDVLKLTRQYELEAEGMSRAQAIKETEKHIVNYRVPAEVAGQRWLSEVLQNPYVLAFSPYHYGLLRGLAHTARDIAVGTGEERLRAVDSAIMMGVVYLGYRAADDQVRKLFGNKNASVKRSGVFGLLDVVEKAAVGDKDARDIVQRIASLNPVATLLATLYEGKDPYTGRDVLRGRDLWEHPLRFAKEIGTVLGGKLMPIKEGIDLATGKVSPQQEILKQLNITDPDPSQAARARIARLKADRDLQRRLRRQFGN